MPGKMLLPAGDKAARPLDIGVLSPCWMLTADQSLLSANFYARSLTSGEFILLSSL